MSDSKKGKEISAAGDIVGGKKVTVTDVTTGAVAIGEGARATVIIQAAEAPAIWVGVPPMPPRMVGRDDLLLELAGELINGAGQALSVQGLPGVGKTTLAVALAHHKAVLARFKDGVLWAGLGPEAKEEDIAAILNRWADALGIDVSGMKELAARQQAVADAIGQKSLLIVVDDAWDYDVVRHLRFGNLNVRTLLTTRDQDIAGQFAGVGGTIVNAPTLEAGPAFQLLRTLAPEAYTAYPETVKELAKSVGGLPLALELLGGYLALPRHKLRPKLSKKALAELMDPLRRLLLAQERIGKAGRQETLQEVITLSIEGLRELENGAELQRAFYALGAFAPKPELFSWEAAEAVAGIEIEELVIRNLLEMAGEQLAMHQVLADVAKTKTDEAAVTRHRDYYLDLVNEDRKDWQHIEENYGQIRRVWESVPQDETLIELILALRVYQNRRGQWQEALAWSHRGLELSRDKQWRDHEGNLLNNMGTYFDNLGQPEEALEYYNQALPILEEVGKQGGLAITLNNIGSLYKDLGQGEKALEYYNKASSIQREIGDTYGLAVTVNNIGALYHYLGQLETALEQYNLVLPIFEDIGDRYELAAALNNIGAIYSSLDQPEKALEYYNQVLFIRDEVGDRSGQAVTLNNLGLVHDKLGQQEKAVALYNQALLIQEEIGDQSGEATTLFNLAMVLRDQDRLEVAVARLKQVVSLESLIKNPNLESDTTLLAQFEAELAAKKEEE